MNCEHKQYRYLLKTALPVLFMLLHVSCFSVVFAGEQALSEQVLMVVGFDGTSWYPYTLSLPRKNMIRQHHWQKIAAIDDANYVTRQPGTGYFFVKDNDGSLKCFSESGQVLPFFPDSIAGGAAASFTQLRAYDGGLVMVQLLQGKSSDTQLVRYSGNGRQKGKEGSCEPLVKQASGQFHPLLFKDRKSNREKLLYGHVSCRLACKPVIQEIWQQDLLTGQARQLTLLNATSYPHSVDESGRFGFISSNHNGFYHLARLDMENSTLTWLTAGRVTDSFPSVDATGNLYFIRRTPKGTALLQMSGSLEQSTIAGENSLTAIALPAGVQKIRYLELSAR